MRTRGTAWLGALVAILVTSATVPLWSVAPAGAASTTVTLTETAPASILYGNPATVVLTADNTGTNPLYNMSIRDVLPAGINYVPGSTSPSDLGEPTVIANQPTPGKTTLIWSNVSDLQRNSPLTITFKLQGDTGTTATTNHVLPGDTYHDTPSIYLNQTPRTIPKFSTAGAPTAATYTAHAAVATPPVTLIAPLAITKTTPQPEHELERGVHDHPDIYTVKVRNSAVEPTDSVKVQDWIPAGLEFLGCGGVDHTTDAVGTYPTHDVEYPGAPRLTTTTSPGLATCVTPTSVTTVTATPPHQPRGIYTLVQWTISTLPAGATRVLKYYAAVPLRENTLTWVATATKATTGVQTANLNNNQGPETVNDQGLTNEVMATGTYQGPLGAGAGNPVSATNSDTVTAHDVAVQKSVSTPTFKGGKTVNFTLKIETSEYRYSTGVTLTDTLPNGLCPIDGGTRNYDNNTATECVPQAGKTPTVTSNNTGTVPTTLPYASVVEHNDGSFTMTWTLGTLPPNSVDTVKFFAVDRQSYQSTTATSTPTLTGDSLTNETVVAGTTHTTCVNGTTPDPLCTGTGTKIYSGEAEHTDTPATNTSHAGQSAPQPTIAKLISVPVTPGTLTCTTATYELTPTTKPFPAYQKGDKICFQLKVVFPPGLHSRNPKVTDFLPPNTTYVAGSAHVVTPTNTVTSTLDTSTASSGVVSWTLGATVSGTRYTSPGTVFLVDLAVTATKDPGTTNVFDLTANLMKFTSLNTTGVATSLRTDVNYDLSRPVLALAKGVSSVKRGTTTVATHTPPADHVEVEDGDAVTYGVTVTNAGYKPATKSVVWDKLPPQIATCTEVSTISNTGHCTNATSPKTIKWTTVSVPAATNPTPGQPSVPGTTRLSYVVTVPAGIGTGQVLTNTAGVVSYVASDNQGVTHTEVPKTNIDATLPTTPNSPAAKDNSTIFLATAMLTKTAQGTPLTATTPGKVTIGQLATFAVNATLPAGTTVYHGTLTDPLEADCPTGGGTSPCLTYEPTSAAVTVTGATTGAFSVSVTNNVATVTFPATYHVPVGHDAHVALTLKATVKDVPGLARGDGLTNTATLKYKPTATSPTTVSKSASAQLTVYEPDIQLHKSDTKAGGPYSPGTKVTYTIAVGNCATAAPFTCADTHVSTAYHVVITDTLPSGETVTGPISNTGQAATVGTVTTITWTLATVGAGNRVTLTYAGKLPNPIIGSSIFKNNAAATTRSLTTAHPTARTTGNGYQATAADTVHTVSPTLTKTVTATTVANHGVTNGVTVTYTVTVHIPADLRLPDLTAIDTLPDGMSFTGYGTSSCTGANTSCSLTTGGVTIQHIGTPTANGSGATALAWYLGNIKANTARTITLHYTARPLKTNHSGTPVASPIVNSVALHWTTTTKPKPTTIPSAGDFAFASTPAHVTVPLLTPRLALTKQASTTKPTPGVPFTYTVTVKNSGTTKAFLRTVTDTLPKGLVFVTGSSSGPVPLHATASTSGTGVTGVVWTFPTTPTTTAVIAAKTGATTGSFSITFSAELGLSSTLSNGQVLRNSAAVPQYYGVPKDTVTAQPTRYVTYAKVTGHATVDATFPALTVAKTAPAGHTARVTAPFQWQLVVHDTTSAPASTVTVTDTLPAFWVYTAGSTTITLQNGTTVPVATANPSVVTAGNVETLTWSGTQLGGIPGTTKSITIAYSAKPTSGTARTVTNVASAAGKDGSGATGNHSGLYRSPQASTTAKVKMVDLTIKKTVGHGLVAGTPANTYDVAVKNLGPDAVTQQVTVADTAPTGTSFTGGGGGTSGWTCHLATAGASISCTHTGTLAATASEPVLVLDIDVPSSYVVDHGKPISNTATVSSATFDKTGSNNTSTVLSTVTVNADLSISKAHTGTFTAGSTGTYQVTVTNNGPSDSPVPASPATRITVKDTLPTGMTATSVTAPGWTCGTVAGETTITCSLTTGLAAHADTVIDLKVKIAPTTAPGRLQNKATITQTTITDPTTGNNSTTNTVTTGASADLSMAKHHATTDHFVPGTPVHYILGVDNLGPSDAHAPVVTDTLPTYETFVSASGTGWTCGHAGQTVTCTATGSLAALATGTPISLVVTLTPLFTGTTVSNTASVTSTTPDPHTTNNAATDRSNPGPATANLTITKTHTGSFTAGSTGTYTITVTNLGPSAAASPITVTDTLPAKESYHSVSGAGWTCAPTGADVQKVVCTHVGVLNSPGTVSLVMTVNVAPTAAGTLVNIAEASSTTPDSDPTNNTTTDATQIVTSADLSLTKTSTDLFTPGTDNTYRLTVANAGPSDAADPTVTDTLPAGESFVSGLGTQWGCTASGQVVTCNRTAPVTAGGSSAITLQVAVDPGYVGSLLNVATVHSVTTDPTLANNTATDAVGPVTPLAHLTVHKSHTGSFVPGTTVSYSITVHNTGPSDNVGGFNVTDTLPVGETYVSASGSGWTCAGAGSAFHCTATGGLAVNGTSTPITVTVSLGATVTGTITNTAKVTPLAGATTDPSPGATSSDPATVAPTADLSIVKTHTGVLVPGTNASYSLAVANHGPSVAAGPVTVTDALPAGETFVSAAGTGWTCVNASNTVTCTLAAGLPPGATAASITLTVLVGGAAYPTVSNTATVHSPTPDATTTNNTSTDPATVKAVDDLSITKAHTGTPAAGQNLTYVLTVANAGPTADPGPVTVVDTLPAGETFVSAKGTGWTCANTGQKVTCTWGAAYPVGTTSTITLVVSLGASAVPSVSNTATVTGTGTDPNSGNNSFTDPATVVPGSTLTLTKKLTSAALIAGGSAIYQLTVANAGPSAATNVVVTDNIPAGLQATKAAGTGWSCQLASTSVVCTDANPLAAGGTSSFTLTATVTAPVGTPIANGASVASTTTLLSSAGTTASTPPTNVTSAGSSTGSGTSGSSSSRAATGGTGKASALAFTGLDLGLLVGAGLLLLLAGLTLMWAGRKASAGRHVRRS